MTKMVIAFAVCVGLIATLTAAAPRNPLEMYIRDALRKPTGELTDDDLVVALGVEAQADKIPFFKAGMAKHTIQWAREQLSDYPILTTTPEQVHISVTEHSGNVSVLWTTSIGSNYSVVCYWPEGHETANSTRCRVGTSWTYNPISVVPWIGTLHGAHMVDLTPQQRYCYQVGDTTIDKMSQIICFACPDLHKEEITIAMGGDMGSVQLVGYLVNEQMIQDEIKNRVHYDAFWLLGDIAYSTLDPGHAGNGEFFWDVYMRQEQNFTSHVPFIPTFGNHDVSGGDSGAFINRFRNPQGGHGHDNFYFSYEHGPIKFVSMCTEPDLVPTICSYAPGSKQYTWLEDQFASINRTRTPWLFLAGHRPMYSSDRSTDSGPLQEYLEPLIRKYNVDVQVTGHMHDTEIIAPVFNNVAYLDGVTKVSDSSWVFANPQAPVHITSGILGAIQDERFQDPSPSWSLYHLGSIFDFSYGFVRLHANRTSLHFEALKQSDDSVMWELRVTKE